MLKNSPKKKTPSPGSAEPKSHADRATAYARRVVAGKGLVCRLVRLTCQRHLDDIKASRSADFPYRWDRANADQVCQFAELMPHVKGRWAGQKIQLQDWQCFLLCVPFGWVRKADGLRRFREIYAEIARKNAKSTLGAIIGLYLAFADGEPGAEVYSGATSLDQALEVFRPAWQMADRSPAMRAHYGLQLGGTAANPGPIFRLADGSRFQAVIGKPGDGASPHGAIVDEYHEHKSPELYDTMKTGQGSRSQPMLWAITTAGTDTSAPCYDHRAQCIKTLEGSISNDGLFVLIYTLDDDDDWKDYATWRKANPNLGVSLFDDYLKGQHRDALQIASKQNVNRTKHLNQWMNAGAGWMNMAKWAACARPGMKPADFAGRRAWLAVDLASKIDIAALLAVVETDDGWASFCRSFLPSETIELPHNAHFRQWRAQGWLTETEGARTDFHVIEDAIREMDELFSVQELTFDPREATYLMQEVETWAPWPLVETPQGPAHMSEPMKEVEALVASRRFLHPDDPLFNWMISNVVLKTARSKGPVKYHYPTKDRNEAKIDGPVALIMAVGRAMKDENKPSIYETRGFLQL